MELNQQADSNNQETKIDQEELMNQFETTRYSFHMNFQKKQAYFYRPNYFYLNIIHFLSIFDTLYQ